MTRLIKREKQVQIVQDPEDLEEVLEDLRRKYLLRKEELKRRSSAN